MASVVIKNDSKRSYDQPSCIVVDMKLNVSLLQSSIDPGNGEIWAPYIGFTLPDAIFDEGDVIIGEGF